MAWRILIGLSGGLLLALAFEPVALGYLSPVGVAAFLLAVRDLPARRAWLPGLAFGVSFEFVLQYWMRAVGTDAWIALSTVEAAFFAVLGPVMVALMRLRHWPVWTALAWVAAEVARATWPLGGMPWGRLAFSTVDTAYASALPYVGANGVSILLALLGSTLAWVVLHLPSRSREVGSRVPASPRTALPAVAGFGLVAVLAGVPAAAPYAADPHGAVTIASVQGNVPGDGSDILLDHRQVTRNHREATQELAAGVAAGLVPRPDFVVWPENSTAVDPFRDPGVNADIAAASTAIGVPILVGGMVDGADEGDVLNQGIVWEPGVGAGERYTKRHPVPFGEYIPWPTLIRGNFGRLAVVSRDMLSGTRVEPLVIAGVPVADAICFDVAYDDGINAQIERGGELLVVQTSNATFIHTSQIRQQFAITRLRAIETHRAVAVAATNGVSGLIGPDGQVVAPADVRTRTVLVESLPLSDEITPGVRVGPWLGRGAVAATAVGLLAAWVAYRRARTRTERGSHPWASTASAAS